MLMVWFGYGLVTVYMYVFYGIVIFYYFFGYHGYGLVRFWYSVCMMIMFWLCF